jgi:RNA polymerase sigma factor (sigma-70 family)
VGKPHVVDPRGDDAVGTAVADLYRALSGRLEQIVRRDVGGSSAVVEDACQFAWAGLVAHAARVRRDRALSWLATTAVREAVRLLHRQNEELGRLHEPEDAGRSRSCTGPPEPESSEDLIDRRERIRLIRRLPERQQRILWLQALGLSHEEIAAHDLITRRTVERQLEQGRRRLRAGEGKTRRRNPLDTSGPEPAARLPRPERANHHNAEEARCAAHHFTGEPL